MRKIVLVIAPLLIALSVPAQTRSCLRVMPVEEIARSASFIGRVKVTKVGKAGYRGMYGQIVTLSPVDVIEGDFTAKEISVLGQSSVPCADDVYAKGQELLVFLEPETSLLHTINFQFGMFVVSDDVVRSWRDKANKIVDRPYEEVRREIIAYLIALRNPQQPNGPGTSPRPTVPPPAISRN